jgi:hypothetical protein
VPIGWDALTMIPRAEAIDELRTAWSWHLPDRYQPVLFSALGDMFYETLPGGAIWWLNTGTANLSKVAESKEGFQRLLGTEVADDWFLPPLIERLVQAGKILREGECYTYTTLPIFREGTYTVDNLRPINAREHFGVTGYIHRQVFNLRDGDSVRIKIVD